MKTIKKLKVLSAMLNTLDIHEVMIQLVAHKTELEHSKTSIEKSIKINAVGDPQQAKELKVDLSEVQANLTGTIAMIARLKTAVPVIDAYETFRKSQLKD